MPSDIQYAFCRDTKKVNITLFSNNTFYSLHMYWEMLNVKCQMMTMLSVALDCFDVHMIVNLHLNLFS